jgi:hypothetical protein
MGKPTFGAARRIFPAIRINTWRGYAETRDWFPSKRNPLTLIVN